MEAIPTLLTMLASFQRDEGCFKACAKGFQTPLKGSIPLEKKSLVTLPLAGDIILWETIPVCLLIKAIPM